MDSIHSSANRFAKKETKQKAIIVDLDGTLCFLKPYEDRHSHDGNEVIIEPMLELLEKEWYPLDVEVIILTGRKHKEYYEITKKWLVDNEIWFDRLILQDAPHAKKNEVFKEEKLNELKEEYDIQMVYDDNYMVYEVCQRLGLPFTPFY